MCAWEHRSRNININVCTLPSSCEKSQIVCTGMYCKEKAIRNAYLFVDKCSTLRRAISEMCKSLACSVSLCHKHITHHLEQSLTYEGICGHGGLIIPWIQTNSCTNEVIWGTCLHSIGITLVTAGAYCCDLLVSWVLLFIEESSYKYSGLIQPGILFIWLPHYYSHLILVRRKAQLFSYLKWPPR